MIVYRLVRANRITLDGKGAAEYPGRWNTMDVPCIYTSASPSLAQLEVLANIDDWKIFITVPHVILRIEVPDQKITIIEELDLPPGWAHPVYTSETQDMGTTFLNNPDILGFSVPSAVNKLERNIILNPRAEGFTSLVKIADKIPFEFDERLLN